MKHFFYYFKERFEDMKPMILAVMVPLFIPVAKPALLISLLVIADFITGVWAARKQGQPITSRKIGHTAIKVTGYFFGLLVALAVSKLNLADYHIMDGMSALLIGRELKSLDENAKVIWGFSLFETFTKLK